MTRQPIDASDWMRNIEKRLMRVERRPVAIQADPTMVETFTFSDINTELEPVVGAQQLPLSDTYTFMSLHARVGIAPMGGQIKLDLLCNGWSIFAAEEDKPVIADGQSNSMCGMPSRTSFYPFDYLTVDITEVGTAPPGGSLTVVVRLRKGAS